MRSASDKIDWATFAGEWHNFNLLSTAKIGNTNYEAQHNRWRYLNNQTQLEIEINVGPTSGTAVAVNTQFVFANIEEAPWLKNGWVRIFGTGQNAVVAAIEFNRVSGQTNNIRFVPVTGATNYAAAHVIIPVPEG